MLHIFSGSTDLTVLAEADEVAAILSAQAGDESAKMLLIETYAPVLRKTVGRFASADQNPDLDLADLQSTAVMAFLTLIEEHNAEESPRLAGRVVQYLTRFLSDEFSAVAAFTVPPRTLRRFYSLVKMHDGDTEAAEASAQEYGMSVDTFRDVLAAVRGTGSLDAALDADTGRGEGLVATPVLSSVPVSDVEDRILVETAFRAVDDEQERICRLAYGFTEYEPVADAEIAHRMNLSRPAVQRKRVKALGSMRKTLGLLA